jgi:hypothetical protein
MTRLFMPVLNLKHGSLEQVSNFLRSRLFLVVICGVVAALSFWLTLVLLEQSGLKSWREFPSGLATPAPTKLGRLPPLPDKRLSWLGIAGIDAQPVAMIPQVVTGLPALRFTAVQEGVHTVAWRVTGLIKNQTYRIMAWVRPLAGANFGIAARDLADMANGPNNDRAYFDLADRRILFSVGNGEPGIEEFGDWLIVWLDLPTTDGQYVVNLYVCKGDQETYAADGRLGVILGGMSVN